MKARERGKTKNQAQTQQIEQKKGENSERNGRRKHPVRHTMLFSEPRTDEMEKCKEANEGGGKINKCKVVVVHDKLIFRRKLKNFFTLLCMMGSVTSYIYVFLLNKRTYMGGVQDDAAFKRNTVCTHCTWKSRKS